MKSLIILFVYLLLLLSLNSKAQGSNFKGFNMQEFLFEGKQARVVFPTQRNANSDWIWRARFWGHEPQLDSTLLAKGFHLVYVDVASLFGNNEAVNRWNRFYEYCRSEFDLNKKVVLEGMSRGGLIIYNWAAQNTDKVACIYADAPVCDIKSWPGGLFKGKGSPADWELCLRQYVLNEETVMDFKDIPINNAANVARAGVPVIHVCGNADEVVPFEENTLPLKKVVRKNREKIKVIVKKGVGHHPHSLKDPAPLVKFILKATGNI